MTEASLKALSQAERDALLWAKRTASTEGSLRPEVLAFAHLMEAKLCANDHKGGWKNEDEDYLLKRLKEEVGELEMACDQWAHSPKHKRPAVGREAAVVENGLS